MTPTIVVLLIALASLGTPLFIILGAGSLLAAWSAGLDPAVVVAEMMRLASSPNLMAIPLFTLAGVVVSRGGAPQRLLRLCNAGFGWMSGGLPVVALISCAFFTAFSGASGVTILALGGLLYPMLVQEKYTRKFSLGLLTSSGSLGLLFPPSLVILLYAIVAGVSIERLFLAGLIPGLLLVAFLALYCMAISVRIGPVPKPFSLSAFASALRDALWDVLLPIGIVVGLFGGFVTVTETATCSAAYALLLEAVIHRNVPSLTALCEALRETAVLVGSLFIILAIALGLTNLLIDAQVPMKLLASMEQSVKNTWHFLLLLNGFLLLVGCLMDIFSAIVVVVPLILPLAQRFGVDPLHLGIVFLANLEIGYLTPPVGINLFLGSQRFREPVLELFRASIPFLLIMLVWLALITYLPELCLWWKTSPRDQ